MSKNLQTYIYRLIYLLNSCICIVVNNISTRKMNLVLHPNLIQTLISNKSTFTLVRHGDQSISPLVCYGGNDLCEVILKLGTWIINLRLRTKYKDTGLGLE